VRAAPGRPAAPARLAAVLLALAAGATLAPGARAQDTIPTGGVRVGITYTPGTRPGLVFARVRTPAYERVQAILQRDLDDSDQFEMLTAPSSAGPLGDVPDYRIYRAIGADFVVALAPAAEAGAVDVQLHDVRRGLLLRDATVSDAGSGGRWAVHRVADEIVRWVTGQPGIAATRLLFVKDAQLWRIDADGEGLVHVPAAGWPMLSPTWAPDGKSIVYTAYVRSGEPLVTQDVATGERDIIPTTEYWLNITPEFSRDGSRLAFARATEDGTDIYVYDVARHCCVTRLTVGRFSDNLSPTWSPDGGRIAFVSTRAGTPQLYWMDADGSNPDVAARFDFGVTGQTNGPAWSPDGQSIAFHRDVGGSPQIFVLDVGTRVVRQLTGSGLNSDPTWAPDGRHVCFVSTRSGERQLWVLDVTTGRVRQLTSMGGARLPAWSPRLPSP
jgi:TolB protein